MKERYPREEVLHTLLLEAEHIVNSRPLTHLIENQDEEMLTPNHFLIGRSCGASRIGPEEWKKVCDHAIKCEDEYRKFDPSIDRSSDKMIIFTGDSSGESESEEEQNDNESSDKSMMSEMQILLILINLLHAS
ncbi:unnamed protein product [Colias eurytheme]|nr:unnamed protein product [Colias eurytheme]